MAITKIHPIRRTLAKAINYIVNPEKTSDDAYISTYGCTKESAEYIFLYTKQKGSVRCFTLAQHAIQSFAPGEIDIKTAHEIGVKLANRYTNFEHEYIVATHNDKEHIHNHIIFNHTNFVTHKAFRGNIKAAKNLQLLSDELCREYGVSIIDNPKKKGMTKYEWMMKNKGLSYKKLLQDNIDICINSSNSYDEFLNNMKKLGYEIKQGKYIAFRKNEQERFVRSKSLGPDYEEPSIKERISNHPPAQIKRSFTYDNSIGLIRNMNNYINAMENLVYRQKVALSNIKKLSATYNYLVVNNIDSKLSLQNIITQNKDDIRELRESIRNTEDQIYALSKLLLNINRFHKYKDIYKQYSSGKCSNSFVDEHYSEILLYETAVQYIKKSTISETTPNISAINKQILLLESQKYELVKKMNLYKEKQKELENVNKNVSLLFADSHKTKNHPPLIR